MTTAPLSLEHLIRPSSFTEGTPPVMFMLHGYGSDENDLFSFAAELPETLCVISVRAPYAMEPTGNAWFAINFDAQQGKWSDEKQAALSREKIVAFIDEACKTYALDDSHITLLGFSQGTILSYAVAISYPEKVKNVIALSGYIDERLLETGYRDKSHKNLSIYASHGQVDQVIPPEWAQRASPFLDTLGIENVYEEFPVGHGVAPQNLYSFKKWLAERI